VGYLPESGNHLALTVTDHHRRAQAVIDQIPPDAKVSVQDRAQPARERPRDGLHFPAHRRRRHCVVDVTGSAWPSIQRPQEDGR